MENQIKQLDELVAHAAMPGNITDLYMLGMANGLILAQAILRNKPPNYLARNMIAPMHDDKIPAASIGSGQ